MEEKIDIDNDQLVVLMGGPFSPKGKPPTVSGAPNGGDIHHERRFHRKEPFTIMWGGGTKKLITLMNMSLIWQETWDLDYILNLSCETQDEGWRADMFPTAFIRIGEDNRELCKFDQPLRSFCGRNSLLIKTNTTPQYFDSADNMGLGFRIPAVARC
jgi:hypothetical protein